MMVHHVHILIYPEARLSRIAKAIKNHSARQANAILGRTGLPFWQDESYDHWVREPEELAKIVSLYGEESGGGGAGEQRGRLAVVERVRHGRRTGQEACPT
jgi:hypothetical protein